jgi:UPF0755 protein
MIFIGLHNTYLLNDYKSLSSKEKVQILIEAGDTGFMIATKLEDLGIIKMSKVFYKIALNDKRARGIAPGIHEVDRNIASKAAIEQLLDTSRIIGVFGFSEGLRKSEIFELLINSKAVTGEFSNNVNPNSIYKTKSLEGFLFPAQYSFLRKTTFDEAILQMLNRFDIAAKESGIIHGHMNLQPYDLVKIASLIQSEGEPQDFSKISRVIYNRLKIGMPLQINATIDYALNLRGDIRLPYKRLEIDSKFNSYKYKGLPPTPISNPGQQALDASVNPAPGEWLYYVTVKPGDTRFTNSYEEFLSWANEFRKNERDGLFE